MVDCNCQWQDGIFWIMGPHWWRWPVSPATLDKICRAFSIEDCLSDACECSGAPVPVLLLLSVTVLFFRKNVNKLWCFSTRWSILVPTGNFVYLVENHYINVVSGILDHHMIQLFLDTVNKQRLIFVNLWTSLWTDLGRWKKWGPQSRPHPNMVIFFLMGKYHKFFSWQTT